MFGVDVLNENTSKIHLLLDFIHISQPGHVNLSYTLQWASDGEPCCALQAIWNDKFQKRGGPVVTDYDWA